MGDVKIIIELSEEQEGYPPVSSEALWAMRVGDDHERFVVDSIPFYARGVSSGDVVRAIPNAQGELIFQKVVEASGNSTFRLYVFEETEVQEVRERLRKMGVLSELSDIPSLIAVEVPGTCTIVPFLDYVVGANEEGKLEYQEASLRHTVPSA